MNSVDKNRLSEFILQEKEKALQELEEKYQVVVRDWEKKSEILESSLQFFEDSLAKLEVEFAGTDISDEMDTFIYNSVQDTLENTPGALEFMVAKGKDGRVYYSRVKIRPEGVTQKLYYQKEDECKVLKEGEWVNSRIKISNDQYLTSLDTADTLEETKGRMREGVEYFQTELGHKREAAEAVLDGFMGLIEKEKLIDGELRLSDEDLETLFYTPAAIIVESQKEIPIWGYLAPDEWLYIANVLIGARDGALVTYPYIIREKMGNYEGYVKGEWKKLG